MQSPQDMLEASSHDVTEMKKLVKLIQDKIRSTLSLSCHNEEVGHLIGIAMDKNKLPEDMCCVLSNRKNYMSAVKKGNPRANCKTPKLPTESLWLLSRDKTILNVSHVVCVVCVCVCVCVCACVISFSV